MNGNASARAGRLKLVVVLALCLTVTALSTLYPALTAPGAPLWYLAYRGLPLLPLAVVLWGIYRASRPALAVLVVGTVTALGNVVGILQFGGADALNRDTALALIRLLVRFTVVMLVFRHDQVSDYWSVRLNRRTRRDLILEIVLFAVSLLLAGLPMALLLFQWR